MIQRNAWRATAGLLAVLLVLAVKGLLIQPPSVAATGFDAARATARLERILGDQRPHPVDTPADDAVRERLIAELRAIGLTPVVREKFDCSGMPKSRVVSCSMTRNVTATIGRGPGRHLLLNAHYDSTPTGPGAADDGIGVAVMLEVAADLQANPPKRPVTLLFNEGEEFGLNGASAFLEHDPLAKRVDALINIDNRGVSGPALMFETSTPNGAAMAAYARATRRPFAYSVATDFAKLIPNTTDVTIFKRAGWTTLSYSNIGNETRYHSPGDTIAALDRRSLAHVGSEVIAATRVLADGTPSRGGQRVYSGIAGRWLFSLPMVAAAIGLALLAGAAALVAWQRQALGRPLGAVAAAFAGGMLLTAVVVEGVAFLRPGDWWRAYPGLAYLAVESLLLAAMAALLGKVARDRPREELRIAAWLLVLLLGGLASLFLPGAIIFFLLAPAVALLGMALKQRWLVWIACGAQLLTFAELTAQIETLLIDGPLWAAALFAALAVLPTLAELPLQRWRPAAGAVGGIALLLWLATLLMPRASAERPGAFTIDYVRDNLHGKANWAVASKQARLPSGWDRFGEWRKGTLPYNARTRWLAKAPMLATPRPLGQVVDIRRDGAGRIVRFALARGGADTVAIRFDKETTITAMGLPGAVRPINQANSDSPYLLRCSGRACDGRVYEVRFANAKPVKAMLIATRFSLPPEGARLAAARPPLTHPQYAPDSSVTIRGVRF